MHGIQRVAEYWGGDALERHKSSQYGQLGLSLLSIYICIEKTRYTAYSRLPHTNKNKNKK
jgi:hypothetical protein